MIGSRTFSADLQRIGGKEPTAVIQRSAEAGSFAATPDLTGTSASVARLIAGIGLFALHPRVALLKRTEAALRPTDADFAWKSLSKITQRRKWHVDEAADQNTAARLQKRPADAHHRIQRLVSAPYGGSL